MQTRISVIIRNFNRCERLARPFESVLGQTVNDYEIVFVDDASTDESVHWVSERYGHLDNLRIIERAVNGGTAAAANDGVQAATGHFVAFLDSDDAWLPGHLETHVRALEKDRTKIGTYCDFFQVWSEYGIERLVRSRTVDDQRREMLLGGFIYSQSLTVLRREAILSAGGFDESYRISTDFDLWLRLALELERPFVHVAAPTVRYYMSNDSVSANHVQWYQEYRRILERGFGHRAAVRYRRIRAEARRKIGIGVVARRELARSIRNPPLLEVSVIIPTHNRCASLERAFESVEAQTYRNFEIIVIDDASRDGTAEWLDRRGEECRIIRFDERRGPAAAFNYGVFASSGSLIACLDDADEWLPDYLLTHVRAFAFASASPVFSFSDYYRQRSLPALREHVRHVVDYEGSDVLRHHLLHAFPNCLSFSVAQKTDILAVNGQNESLAVGADISLQLKLLYAYAKTDARKVPAHIARPLGVRHCDARDEVSIPAKRRLWEDYAEAIFRPLLGSDLGAGYSALSDEAIANLLSRLEP